MHTEWREHIPFYVAGTLPPNEANTIKQHLDSCATCRSYLKDWQEIRDGVFEEAQEAAHPLPPLNIQAMPNGHHISDQHQSQPQRNRLSLTLAAASIMMVMFVGLIIATNQNPEATASQLEPICLPDCPDQSAVQTDDMPVCTVKSTSENAITLHAAPDTTSEALTTIQDESKATVIARSDSHWYRVRYISVSVLWVGWVDSEHVELDGDCDALPLVNLATPPD